MYSTEGERGFCVCAMEDILEVYQRVYDEDEVLVCMDESSKQQVKETRVPRAPQPGKLAKFDYEYERNGVSNLVMDNLNTHKPGSLYEAFEPQDARRIAERLEIHYTPKHGRWLDMAEIDIGVMSRQCLNRRIPDQATLRREMNVWQQQRNQKTVGVNWRFTTADARIKLTSLYPSILA